MQDQRSRSKSSPVNVRLEKRQQNSRGRTGDVGEKRRDASPDHCLHVGGEEMDPWEFLGGGLAATEFPGLMLETIEGGR